MDVVLSGNGLLDRMLESCKPHVFPEPLHLSLQLNYAGRPLAARALIDCHLGDAGTDQSRDGEGACESVSAE
ncbi:hypothetical protein HKX48_007914, partial [Thoreauomyces humboldtii]